MPSSFQFSQSTSFDSLLQAFTSEKILSQNTDKSIKILEHDKLIDFAFAIFTSLLTVSKRPGLPSISFINIDDQGTLFLIEPYGHTSAFAKHKGIPVSFIDNPSDVFQRGDKRHSFCDLRASIHYNLSKFRRYNKFRGVFNQTNINGILRILMATNNKSCNTHTTEILDFIKTKLKTDENHGILFGGYPILLKTPLGLFRKTLEGTFGKKEIVENLLSLFDFIITVLLAERNKSTVFISNATLETPFKSFEIDSAVIKSPDKLLVVETTSSYHELKHSKNKIINFISLKSSVSGNFKYVYLTFKAGKKTKMYNPDKQSLEDIDIKHDCEHTGPISWITEKEPHFIFLDLGKHADIDINLNTPWWDTIKLREAFNYYIENLNKAIDTL